MLVFNALILRFGSLNGTHCCNDNDHFHRLPFFFLLSFILLLLVDSWMNDSWELWKSTLMWFLEASQMICWLDCLTSMMNLLPSSSHFFFSNISPPYRQHILSILYPQMFMSLFNWRSIGYIGLGYQSLVMNN